MGGKLDWLAFGLPGGGHEIQQPLALSVARRDAPTARLGEKVDSVRGRIVDGWSWCPVLNEEGIVLGRLRRRDLDEAEAAAPVESVMQEGPSTYRPDVPCAEMVDTMKKGRFELAFITDPDGRWVGLMSRADAESALEAWRARRAS